QDDLGQNLEDVTADKRQTPRQQLIEDYSKAKEIGPSIDPVSFAICLFRAHIGRRPGNAGAAEIFFRECQAEIRQIRLATAIQKNVGRLDVPVYQPEAMDLAESTCNCDYEPGGLSAREAASSDCLLQINPFDELGNHIAQTVSGAANIVNRNDM